MSAGYLFTPLADYVYRISRPSAVFDRRVAGAISGTINVIFQTKQPLHVGSGSKALHHDEVLRRGALVRGRPGVPGSSMKGVLRSRFEAITRSCSAPPPKEADVRSKSHRGVEKAQIVEEARTRGVFEGKCGQARELCPACALFGRMSQRSRVTVTDFAAVGDSPFVIASMPEQFAPNLHHLGPARVRREGPEPFFEVRSLDGRKFAVEPGLIAPNAQYQQVEAIPAGSMLQGSLRVFNVTEQELGGLLAALGKQPPSALKIGAGKAYGFGRVVLETLNYSLRDHAGKTVAPDEAGWRGAFVNSRDRWKSGEDALVRIHHGKC